MRLRRKTSQSLLQLAQRQAKLSIMQFFMQRWRLSCFDANYEETGTFFNYEELQLPETAFWDRLKIQLKIELGESRPAQKYFDIRVREFSRHLVCFLNWYPGSSQTCTFDWCIGIFCLQTVVNSCKRIKCYYLQPLLKGSNVKKYMLVLLERNMAIIRNTWS